MKKSLKLLLDGMADESTLLCLKASEMVPQTNSEIALAFSPSNNLPTSSKMHASSPVEQAAVSVSLARSSIGL